MDAWGSNSDFHACMAVIFQTETSPQYLRPSLFFVLMIEPRARVLDSTLPLSPLALALMWAISESLIGQQTGKASCTLEHM